MLSSSQATKKPSIRGVLLALLLGTALLSPFLSYTTYIAWLPDWFGAAVSVTALLGALCVLWRSAELRGLLLVSFMATLAFAAGVGWLLARAV